MGRASDENIIHQLRQKIRSGGFDKTTFLPSERKLADEYQVGRGIIRGALKVLSGEGIIYNVPKRGYRVKKKNGKRLKRIILRLPIQVSAKAYEAMALVAGICAGANELFAEIILSTPPACLNLSELHERFNADDIQGIIFLESSPDLPLEEIKKAGIPFVIANLEEEKEYPGASVDYRGSGRIAGQELLKRNYRKIGVYTGPADRFLYRELLAGFRGALAEEKLQISDDMYVSGSWDETPKALKELLSCPADKRPEAIFTLRDYRAAQVYTLCEELGLKIPEDIGVISFDGISWPGAEKAGLTSIAEDAAEIGRQAVLLLQKQFESGYTPVRCLVSGTLINGKSLRQTEDSARIIYLAAEK
ncbi:MAG: GntR family transcriptional regulator [Lentisphaeria bacterium]|nr:GntR family transcriptional regulator [Lentisphaeria bacterium]